MQGTIAVEQHSNPFKVREQVLDSGTARGSQGWQRTETETEDRRTHLSQKATGCLPEFTESKSAVIFSSDDLLLMQVTCWYCDQVNQLKAEVGTHVYALLPRSSMGLRKNQDLS